jgi:hypothetical protein
MLTLALFFDDPKDLLGLKKEEAHQNLMKLAEDVIRSGGTVEVQTMPFRRVDGKTEETFASLEDLPLLHRKLDEFYHSV